MEQKRISSQNSIQNNDNIIQQDLKRYQRKGYGLIMAIFFIILGLLLIPNMIYYSIYLLNGYTPRQINNIILISSNFFTLFIGNLGLEVIYRLKHPFFERYRIRSNPWPWDEDKEAWNKKKIIVLKNWIMNFFIGSSISIVDSYFSEIQRSDLESYPTYFEMLQQILLSLVIEDTLFYWIHRTLHHPKLYPLIHKKHHEFYTTVSISAVYAHPLEFAFGDALPVFAASKLLGAKMHLVTVTTWLIMRIGEAVDGHSGYEFSWSPFRLLPFSSSSEYHNYHHSHNIGNYGSFFSIWDTICGTNQHFNKYRKEIENAKKQKSE